MPDLRLKQAVQSVLSSFVEERRSTHDDIAQDVYRIFRDEANLLLEREFIFDTLDSDPFHMMKLEGAKDGGDASDDDIKEKKKNADIIARVKELIRVVSCTRIATAEGYSFIEAIVQLEKDENMQGVDDNIRLHFSFLREPHHYDKNNDENTDSDSVDHNVCCHRDKGYSEGSEHKSTPVNSGSAGKRKRSHDTSDNLNDLKSLEAVNVQNAKKSKHSNGPKSINNKSKLVDKPEDSNSLSQPSDVDDFKPKTIISYKIEYSIDYGKFEKLFGVDIYASSDVPSIDEAIPLMDGCDDASNDESGDDRSKSFHDASTAIKAGAEFVDGPQTDDAVIDEASMSSNQFSCGESLPSNVKNGNPADRFGAFVEPENIVKFLDHSNINFDEKTVFYFLLMFPFYEHEWDVSGFLMSSLFDEDDIEDEGYEEGNCFGGGMCVPCNEKE